MLGDYRTLRGNIQNRLNPEGLQSFQKALNEELRSITYSDVLQYVKVAMQGVSEEYTQRSKDAGEKVKEHLQGELTDVTYRFQGSVMTNTHIRGYSDIDLLVITDKSYSYASADAKKYINDAEYRKLLYESQIEKLVSETSGGGYAGDQLADLKNIRIDSERVLSGVYTECDTSKSKCIRIRNKNLGRDVDLVVASYYDDVRSIIYDKGINRGIQIYFKDEHTKGNPDFPFVSIQRINDRSTVTNGRLKKMIRFLKNVKSDSDQDIDLSSFDINAICYDIDENVYRNSDYTQLVAVLYSQLYKICNDTTHADKITSVDDREYIFRGRPTKLNNLRKILAEVTAVYLDIQKTPLYA